MKKTYRHTDSWWPAAFSASPKSYVFYKSYGWVGESKKITLQRRQTNHITYPVMFTRQLPLYLLLLVFATHSVRLLRRWPRQQNHAGKTRFHEKRGTNSIKWISSVLITYKWIDLTGGWNTIPKNIWISLKIGNPPSHDRRSNAFVRQLRPIWESIGVKLGFTGMEWNIKSTHDLVTIRAKLTWEAWEAENQGHVHIKHGLPSIHRINNL